VLAALPERSQKAFEAWLDALPEAERQAIRLVMIADKIQDRAQSERFLRAWVYEAQASGLVQLVKFTQTLQHWWVEFLNYFNEGFTSGVVEGLNNAIRGTIRRAYGYHVFEHFRLHVMVEHGALTHPLPLI